jgi:hypothetical protein
MFQKGDLIQHINGRKGKIYSQSYKGEGFYSVQMLQNDGSYSDFISTVKESEIQLINENISTDKQKVITALKQLDKAFKNLVEVWQEGENDSILNELKAMENYPFINSLDELSIAVSQWVEEATKEIIEL